MRFTRPMYAVAALLLVGAVSMGCYSENPTMGPASKLAPPPKPVHFETKLASTFAAEAMGWAMCESNDGFIYFFDAELTINAKDFKEFNIDPSNGFDDESVLIAVTKKDILLKMVFSHLEMDAVVFAVHESNLEWLPVTSGDQVIVTVNAEDVAGGKF